VRKDVLRAVAALEQNTGKETYGGIASFSQFHLSSIIDVTQALAALERLSKYCQSDVPKPTLNDLCIFVASRVVSQTRIIDEVTGGIGFVIQSTKSRKEGVIKQADSIGLLDIAKRTQEFSESTQEINAAKFERLQSAFLISCVDLDGINNFLETIASPVRMNLSLGQVSEHLGCSLMTTWLSANSNAIGVGAAASLLKTLRDALENPFEILFLL
jgi:hypothetical protein